MDADSEILRQYGIRPSARRVAVLNFLVENYDRHLSTEEIYQELHETLPDVARTTIINTLTMFENSGVLKRLALSNGKEVFDAVDEPHGHFICTRCKRIINVPISAADWKTISTYGGPASRDMQIVWRGLCDKCLLH